MNRTGNIRLSIMDDFKVGDLVQYHIEPTILKYRRVWQNKVGVITAIRKVPRVAYIKWSDLDANDTWISYDDLRLLNRE